LRKELDGLSVSAPDAKQKLDQIGRSFETMNVQAQKGAVDLRAYGQSWEKSLTTAFSKMLLWAAAGDLLFSSIHFFTKGIAYVNDLNKSLTEISIVTGKNQKQISDLGLEYQKLASEMAVSTKEIANASVTFFRQGLDQVSVMERIRVPTEYAKVANLDFAQSSELLTAAVNSMDLPIQRVADVFNLLGDLTSTGPDELGIAFQKVGGTVQSANIEFEKMASWISTISARTREAPSSIGDAMKSMLARFMNITQNGFDEEEGGNINDVSTALKSVGVELVNAEGNFNDFGKIVDQLGAKWDTLDSRTRAYLGTALAGKFCPAM
jgi:TP901 family phage tail tape measure protein